MDKMDKVEKTVELPEFEVRPKPKYVDLVSYNRKWNTGTERAVVPQSIYDNLSKEEVRKLMEQGVDSAAAESNVKKQFNPFVEEQIKEDTYNQRITPKVKEYLDKGFNEYDANYYGHKNYKEMLSDSFYDNIKPTKKTPEKRTKKLPSKDNDSFYSTL